jgi:hypothetical protein
MEIKIQAEDSPKIGSGDDIWEQRRGSNRRMDNIAC